MSEANIGEPAVVIERRSGGGIGVFLFGLALGAGLALLYAPQAGIETRRELRRGARRVRRKVRDLGDDAQDAAHEFVRTTRDAARDTREALERRLARHQPPRPDEDDDDDEDSGV